MGEKTRTGAAVYTAEDYMELLSNLLELSEKNIDAQTGADNSVIGKEKVIGECLRNELAGIERRYEEDPMDCWVNGYRNALRTVLREVNRRCKEEEVSK